MHSKFTLLAAAAALAASASAQDFIGFTYNEQTGATSRGSLGASAGEVMTRIDGSEYAGWGTGTAGMRTIDSIFMLIQDQDAFTPETFDVKVYPEDALNPGFPDMATGVTFVSSIAGPTSTTPGTIAAAGHILTPSAPVSVPIVGGGDIFVSIVLPAALLWPADGLSSHICLGYAPSASFTVFDIPGQAQQPLTPSTASNSHGLTVPALGSAVYSTRRNWVIDVGHSTAGGVVMGVTNQASALGSNNPPPAGFGPAPGTADFMSGVSPDVSMFDPLRSDDVTMDYYRTGSGTPLVFFLLDIGPFAPVETPLAFYLAGSTGVQCINATALNAGFVVGASDEAFKTTTFPAGMRPFLVGLPLVQQAIELDTVNFVAHGSPCGRQVF